MTAPIKTMEVTVERLICARPEEVFGLPDSDGGRGHERGWNFFLGAYCDRFAAVGTKDAQ